MFCLLVFVVYFVCVVSSYCVLLIVVVVIFIVVFLHLCLSQGTAVNAVPCDKHKCTAVPCCALLCPVCHRAQQGTAVCHRAQLCPVCHRAQLNLKDYIYSVDCEV